MIDDDKDEYYYGGENQEPGLPRHVFVIAFLVVCVALVSGLHAWRWWNARKDIMCMQECIYLYKKGPDVARCYAYSCANK